MLLPSWSKSRETSPSCIFRSGGLDCHTSGFEVRLWKASQTVLCCTRCVHHPVDFVGIQQPLPSWMQAEFYESLSTLACARLLVKIQLFLGVVSLSVPADSTASEAEHFGEIVTHHFLSMHFSRLWPAVFWWLFLHPGLESHTEKGTSRTSLSSRVCLLEMALAMSRVCFSTNTTVQYLQDSAVLLEDSMVRCRCTLSQPGANPREALGCCWRQREVLAKTMAIIH